MHQTIVFSGDNDLAKTSDHITMPGGEEGALPENTKRQNGSEHSVEGNTLCFSIWWFMIPVLLRTTQTNSLEGGLTSQWMQKCRARVIAQTQTNESNAFLQKQNFMQWSSYSVISSNNNYLRSHSHGTNDCLQLCLKHKYIQDLMTLTCQSSATVLFIVCVKHTIPLTVRRDTNVHIYIHLPELAVVLRREEKKQGACWRMHYLSAVSKHSHQLYLYWGSTYMVTFHVERPVHMYSMCSQKRWKRLNENLPSVQNIVRHNQAKVEWTFECHFLSSSFYKITRLPCTWIG